MAENEEALRTVVNPNEGVGGDVVDVFNLARKRFAAQFGEEDRVGRTVFDLRETESHRLAEQTGDCGFVGGTFGKLAAGAGAVNGVVFLGVGDHVAGGGTLENGGGRAGDLLVIFSPIASGPFACAAADAGISGSAVRGVGEVDELIKGGTFDLRKDHRGPAPHTMVVVGPVAAVVKIGVRSDVEVDAPGRKTLVHVFVRLHRKSNVLHVARALHTTSRFTRRLDGGKKKTDQDTNNCDYDQQFDERKSVSLGRTQEIPLSKFRNSNT